MRNKILIVLLLIPLNLIQWIPALSQAQQVIVKGELKGYVYEQETGFVVPLATITLLNTNIGGVTNEYGFFVVRKIPLGKYTLVVRCVGYEEFRMPVNISSEEMESQIIRLTNKSYELEMATITAARKRWERMTPVGTQRLTVESMSKTPTLGVQSDLAQVLQTMPGVIFTGDRGGQLYVRGGAPSHNKVLLDGMTVINPFHSIGFMSVFDTEILQSVDVFSAAYGAQYGGRVSS
ncbi:MAG: TonB-dependent receptor, partial [Bacteroidales bacterium]